MRISELDNKAFLANDGVGDNSYVVITYAEDANDSPVSFKATLNELGRLIVSNMKLAQYDTQNDKKDLGTLVGVSKLKPTPAPEPSEESGDEEPSNEESVVEEPETEEEPIEREVYNPIHLGQFLTDADRPLLTQLETDFTITNSAGKTVNTITQTSGETAATFQDIAITSAQITDRADGTNGSSNIGDTVVKTNSSGIIPSQLLPSYVDDVLEFANKDAFPTGTEDTTPDDGHAPTGPEKNKIYLDLATGRQYRWSGSAYVETGVIHLDYTDTASASQYVSEVNQTDGLISVTRANFSPTITWTDGTSSAKPTISISVAGNNAATAATPNEASTTVYGITKLSNAIDSDSEVLAATPKAVKDALADAISNTTNEINKLDVNDITGFGAGQTLSALTETDGKISASFQDIEIAHTKVTGLGTAATKNAPTSGNAGNNEVVLGNDSRLTDARNAADVSAWAKASTKPSYTAAEVHALPDTIVNVSSFTNDAGYLTSHQDISGKANSSDLAAVATSGDYGDLINTPTINTTDPVFTTSITIGNTTITEAQLQALLELLNSGE